MKILHINSYYSHRAFYKNLYDRQKSNGMDIEVYVPVPENFLSSNLTLGEYTNISRNHGKYDRLIFQIKQSKIFDDIVKTYDINKFSLLHAHSLFTNGNIAYQLKKLFNVPYIVAVRDTDVNVFFKYMFHLRRLGVEILKEADKVIFLSETYRSYVIKNYIPNGIKKEITDKSKIIPNGIDDFWLQNKGTSKILKEPKKINILTVGVVSRRKNQLTTTKAIKLLQEKGYEIKYTIVGNIKDKKIYQKIKDLACIQYIPHTTCKEELLKIYRTNDIFAMPSITETFGLVYPEAMSQGLPVIYTRGQGFDGQFKEGEVGYSVDAMNIEDIASKVIAIRGDFAEMSKRCINSINKFDWNRITNCYEKIYRSVL